MAGAFENVPTNIPERLEAFGSKLYDFQQEYYALSLIEEAIHAVNLQKITAKVPQFKPEEEKRLLTTHLTKILGMAIKSRELFDKHIADELPRIRLLFRFDIAPGSKQANIP